MEAKEGRIRRIWCLGQGKDLGDVIDSSLEVGGMNRLSDCRPWLTFRSVIQSSAGPERNSQEIKKRVMGRGVEASGVDFSLAAKDRGKLEEKLESVRIQGQFEQNLDTSFDFRIIGRTWGRELKTGRPVIKQGCSQVKWNVFEV